MQTFLTTLDNVFNTLGSIVFVPVILFIIAKILGVKTEKAFKSALLCAVGLKGFSLVVDSYSKIITPVVNLMVKNSGVNLKILDTGWQNASVIAYSTKIGILFIGVALLFQTALFLLKWTDCFMPSDLWNNYSYMIWGSMLYIITGNIWLSLILMLVQNLYSLLCSDILAKRWSTYYGYPGCCMTAAHNVCMVPYAIGINWILNKLGANKIKLNARDLQKKFGILGEPMFIGLVVGALIAIIAYHESLGELVSWGVIASSAISTASVMAVFPKVAAIFASAFSSLTDASSKKVQGKGSAERKWYLAINDAAGYGEPNTLVSGILLMPIMLFISFVLPGNQVLPMVDLVAIPYGMEAIVAISNGNIMKSIISGAIWLSIGMLLGTQVAPIFTSVAVDNGYALSQAGTYIISLGTVCRPEMLLIFLAFKSMNPFIIGAVIVGYFVLYFIFKKYKKQIVDYMETCNDINNQESVTA